MKKYLVFILILSLCILFGCSNEQNKDNGLQGDSDYSLSYGAFTDESYLYSQMELFCGTEEIPVYNVKVNFGHSWNPDAPSRLNNGVAIVSIKGKVKFNLKTAFNIKGKCKIRPLEQGVEYREVGDKELEFLITKPGQYTIEFSNDRTLHLFVNEYDKYSKDVDPSFTNIIYFGPGVHNKNNNKYISSDSFVHLSSNTAVFIDEGAVVEAGFEAANKSNIKIYGNGIISGACFDRSATTNSKLIPLEFNYCSNIKFEGISNLDPAGWCYNIYFCKNVTIDNIKIISSRANGDGVSIQSCENVTCKNSFVRSWDDSLVVKNYPRWDNRSIEGTTKNIKFYNCVIWTDLAQSMEVGFETVGSIMEDITFEKITVLHNFHKAVISLHNANNANVKNVTYKDIIVEDAQMGKGDGRNVLIELTAEFSSTWSNGHKTTSLGQVDGVLIENVKVLNECTPLISLRGSIDARAEYDNSIHYVANVTIKDLFINNKKIDNTYSKLEEVYTKNISFE